MNKIVEFLNANPVQYLATVGRDSKAKRRPFMFSDELEGKLWFCTNNQENVYKDMQENPEIEISFSSPEYAWIRLHGKAVFENNMAATKDKISISLRGKIKNIGSEKLDEIFVKTPYMQAIYPGDTRAALEVFCLYEAEGEYFDSSDPAHVTHDSIVIGHAQTLPADYFVGNGCIGCKLCYSVCPQKCIDIKQKPVSIDQHRCLHCGRCAEICPKQTIVRRG